MELLLGQKIELPNYTEEQKELWIDKNHPIYTGIMAAVNNIAHQRFGCFIDELTEEQKDLCFALAEKIGLAWIILPED
jgi:hypothetical protein